MCHKVDKPYHIQFSLISPEIWCYRLHFADKETEAQGGLATSRVTRSFWLVQVFFWSFLEKALNVPSPGKPLTSRQTDIAGHPVSMQMLGWQK